MTFQSSPSAWHCEEVAEALRRLGTDDASGLSAQEAAARLQQHGPNELTERGGRTIWQILWEQVSSVLILILLLAAALAAFLGKAVDALAILAIVVIFAVLGFLQEYRAQRAIAALKRMAAPTVKVLRGGNWAEMSARELVPGDIVRLETGAVVPADCRVIESVNLRLQEAALTGESEPVEKVSEALAARDLTVGDRRNMAYLGTFASFGRGLGAVVATGMATELGRIASLLQSVEHHPTPLQRRLDGLGKVLALIAVVVGILIVGFGALRGDDIPHLLLTGVSLAVAIVPEGLPAVLTFTLALGAQRMLKRKALIRKLPAVETLGSVTVICSDKTGTLTQNRMTVTRLETASSILDLPSTATGGGGLELPSADPAAALVLSGASLCNDAQLAAGDGDQGIGDPTETALLVAAARLGLRKPTLDAALPRAAELPFDSDRKRMTTIHRLDGGELPQVLQPLARLADGAALAAFTKGAADGMVGSCDRIWTAGGLEALSPAWREKIAAATERMAADGMRVLGVALRYWPSLPTADESSAIERDLIFLGLVAMIDPPRAEAKAAVATCKAAGIRPIMITGDHPVTARYIAAELGMASHDGPVVTGRELEQLDADSLAAAVRCSNVFARVSPEHKLRIVEALQQQGHVVAMTGDGVNDAPALKKADIGVAMGSGTDVAKEAADMVLLDDNFATIVAAVEEGRVVYDNVRRFVAFSIAGNIGKVLTVAVPPFFGLPLLLMPIQILFSNLLTDGLLGLGLGFEKAERNTMRRPPYSPAAGVLSGGMSWHVGLLGALIGVLMIGLGYLTWAALTADGDLSSDEAVYLSTVVFTTLALLQLGRVMSTRSFTDPLFRLSLFANPLLLAMILLALGLQMIAVYLPSAQPFFLTVGLPASDLAIGVAIAAAVLAIMEMEKAWRAQGARPATRREAWDTSPS